ncbi:MAG TPA: hypothetical protein VNS34_22645 [Rhizobiaceae bacterium]|nr:hypothetical protein [Rhizobiaceae bacterium]
MPTFIEAKSLHAVIAALFMTTAVPQAALLAQGLHNREAVDKIIGSDVKEEEAQATVDADRVIAAIEKTSDNIGMVRKTSKLDKVDIVFLTDAAITEGGPPPEIEAKVKEHQSEVTELRQEIEGNAMLYHAIESRQVLLRDVLAVDFDGSNSVVIYAAAKPPR